MSDEQTNLSRRRLLHLGVFVGAAAALGIPVELMTGLGSAATANPGFPNRTVAASPTELPPTAIGSAIRATTIPATTRATTGGATTGGATTGGATTGAGLPHSAGGAGANGPGRLAVTHVDQHLNRSSGVPRPAEPAWVHTWDDPISRLGDFVARSPHTHYARNAIMLTIDDGPHPVWTPKYLRLLAKHHVQATFSVIGQQVRQHPDLVKAAVHDGHQIANHTYRHPLNLPRLSAARIGAELADTNDAIVRATGFRPRQFRAPGGVWGPDVYAEVSRQEMMPLGWDIDPRDWALPGVTHIRSAMLAARPHDIILCHDGGGDRSETYRALETVIPALLARGWQFVTLPSPQHL